MKAMILAALLLTPTAASASTLWGRVESGMSRQQVEALYPAGKDVSYRPSSIHFDHVVVTPKCKADTDVLFVDNVVSEIKLSGNGSIMGGCANDVLVALSSKYGEPSIQTENRGGGLFSSRSGRTHVWNRGDGWTMQFKNYSDGSMGGGGGLGRKSWELKYTTAGETIGL